MAFISPSRGRLSFEGVCEDILSFVHEAPSDRYNVIVGSDSQVREGCCFVTAVIVHRIGKGAKYYYQRRHHPKIYSLRQKILYEATLSLNLAGRLSYRLAGEELDSVHLEIHLDIGQNGETRELIREIVGMVVGSGFEARIKPDAYAATKVADRFTK